jgi:1-acyl-sn-glycerol-3-phosphate acyltransferase
MLRTIAGFGFAGLFAVILIPIGLIQAALHLCGGKRAADWIMCKIATWWSLTLIRITGSTVEVSGTENIPKKGGVCIISSHESIFDIVLHMAYEGRFVGFIARSEIGLIPPINLWILLLGGLLIKRNDPRKAVKTIEHGAENIKKGACMLIFPEGTRSKTGKLAPFRVGAFKLATEAGALIVPAAITGSRAVFEQTGKVCPSNITVHYGTPIDTKTLPFGEKRQALADRAYSEVAELMAP